MIFANLAAGSDVFLDANTLVYHFQPHPAFGLACRELLDRIALGEVSGYASSHIVSDVAHRLMTLEAIQRFGWPMAGIVTRLKNHPGELQQLSIFRQTIDQIPQLGIHVLPVTQNLVAEAGAISQQYGLLSGDALVVAVMREQGLTNLASHDADFDRAPGLVRYSPV
jgi:predicted nucleic acid-binding protein